MAASSPWASEQDTGKEGFAVEGNTATPAWSLPKNYANATLSTINHGLHFSKRQLSAHTSHGSQWRVCVLNKHVR